MPPIHYSSYVPKIKKICHKKFYIPVKQNKNLFNRIKCDRFQSNFMDSSNKCGVYSIPIKSPDNSFVYYIGSTINSLAQRITQHKYNYQNLIVNNKYSNSHLIDFLSNNSNYVPIWEDAKIIDSDRSRNRIRLRETVHIICHNNAVNNILPQEMPMIFKSILVKRCSQKESERRFEPNHDLSCECETS